MVKTVNGVWEIKGFLRINTVVLLNEKDKIN